MKCFLSCFLNVSTGYHHHWRYHCCGCVHLGCLDSLSANTLTSHSERYGPSRTPPCIQTAIVAAWLQLTVPMVGWPSGSLNDGESSEGILPVSRPAFRQACATIERQILSALATHTPTSRRLKVPVPVARLRNQTRGAHAQTLEEHRGSFA